jgi:hypothetical protein
MLLSAVVIISMMINPFTVKARGNVFTRGGDPRRTAFGIEVGERTESLEATISLRLSSGN